MSTSTESAADQSFLSEITTHPLPGGMTVLVQPMPWLRTAAFTLSLRSGIQTEPDDRAGLASMVCEMVQRGAGSFSSRDLVAMQDNLGMDRNSGVSTATASCAVRVPSGSTALSGNSSND